MASKYVSRFLVKGRGTLILLLAERPDTFFSISSLFVATGSIVEQNRRPEAGLNPLSTHSVLEIRSKKPSHVVDAPAPTSLCAFSFFYTSRLPFVIRRSRDCSAAMSLDCLDLFCGLGQVAPTLNNS